MTWADVAGADPTDPDRVAVEAWLNQSLPGWRAAAWADAAPPA